MKRLFTDFLWMRNAYWFAQWWIAGFVVVLVIAHYVIK